MASSVEVKKSYGILIGINEYLDDIITDLSYSVSDIESINELLSDTNRGGYESENLKKMVDTSSIPDLKPSRNNIMSQISHLSSVATSNDSLLFYFSGHGIEKAGVSYLLPNDARYNVLDETSIRVDWIKDIMSASNARVKIIILDACHSGAIKGKSLSGQMTKGFEEAIFPAPEGFIIFASCTQDQVSWEDDNLQHGVFSYYLSEGLRGNADYDKNSVVSITEANKYTFENVSAWALTHSKSQSPNLNCSILGDVGICRVPSDYIYSEPAAMAIEKIELVTENLSDVDEVSDKVCGFLLNFVEPKNVVYNELNGVTTFKTGEFKKGEYQGDNYFSFVFDYSEPNRQIVDDIIQKFSDYNLFKFDWIKFKFNGDIDLDYLAKSCRERGFKITSYNVKARTVQIESPTELKGNVLRITFYDRSDGSWIMFMGGLGKDFYKKINPRTVMQSFIIPSHKK